MAKTFYILTNVGSAKYVLNFHDGNKQHADGSPFYDCVIFSNKIKLNKKVKKLFKNGYLAQ